MKAHPAADLLPMLSKPKLAELAEDIRKHTLLFPIVTYEGLILDGRNRFQACKIAGVEPRFTEWAGEAGSPTQYVASVNVKRRDLSVAERAAFGVGMLPLLEAEAKKRQQEHGGTAPGRPAETLSTNWDEVKGRSADIAAKAVGVGRGTIGRARQVKHEDPEAFERLKKGETTVNAEWEKVRKTPPPPRKSTATEKHKVMRGNAAKRKMITALSSIEGSCMGLEALALDSLRQACSEEEAKLWASQARKLASRLRAFANKLDQEETNGK